MKYEIGKLIGQYCMTVEDGDKLYNLIHPELVAGHPVELDFAEVIICSPPFLHPGIGRLFKDIQLEDFHRLLEVSNLNHLSMTGFKLAIEDAHKYYTDENFRNIIDEVSARRLEEWSQ